MNATRFLPWLLVLGLGVGLAAVYVSSSGKEAELTRLRASSEELPKVQADLNQGQEKIRTLQGEIESLREDKQELLRLRGEVTRLRQENQQLSTQVQTAQSQAQRAQAQASQAMQAGAQQMQQLQQQNTELRTAFTQNQQVAQRNACINQLRMLDGAKQQWALENQKPGTATPTLEDVTAYLSPNSLPLKCPAGGTYAVNAVNQPPTCTIPGHVLPQQ